MPKKEVKMDQLSLFEKETEQNYQVEEKTTVRLGRHRAQVPLKKRRREAYAKLKEILEELEGKDVLVSSCWGAHSHFWADNLVLRRLKVEWGLNWGTDRDNPPTLLVLWGTMAKGLQQNIRVFLDQLWNVRTNDYGSYTHYLIDFWNGWGEYPLDQYRPRGSVSLVLSLGRNK
jgi:hypothetical protein